MVFLSTPAFLMFLTIHALLLYDFLFFQAEDGIRDFCLSRGLGDVYKRQVERFPSEVLEQPLPALVQTLHIRLRQALVIGPIKAEDRL